MVRCGIIGGGSIGRQHARELKASGADVQAIAEPIAERRAEIQAEFAIPEGFDDGLALIEKASLDAVSVCGPNFLHNLLTVAALERGMHVLCEKPPAMSRFETAEMVRAADRSGKLLMMAFNQMFDSGIVEIRALNEQGFFGEIYHAHSKQIRRLGDPGSGRAWFVNRETAGAGVSFDLGSHAFYRAWYAMGKPTPMSATAALHRKFVTGDVDDFAAAFIRFEGGESMVTEASWVSTRSDVGKITDVMGTKAGASFCADRHELTLVKRTGDAFEEERRILEPGSYITKFQHFVDCIVNGTECLCPGADGHTVQCVLDAILESSECGETVSIDAELDLQ